MKVHVITKKVPDIAEGDVVVISSKQWLVVTTKSYPGDDTIELCCSHPPTVALERGEHQDFNLKDHGGVYIAVPAIWSEEEMEIAGP